MKRKRGWLLAPLVILALLICAVPAYAIPPMPHPFYGTITIGGTAAPEGTVITAKVGGVQYGSYTTTVVGQYGSSNPLDGDYLVVQGEIEAGATISFYAGVNPAEETYAFESGADPTELNLTVTAEDTTSPTVSSTSPTDGETDVAIGTAVSVTFSEAMASATITTSSFTLDSVAGSVSYESGTYTATFTPSADLAEGTTYTATLSTAITDFAGNPLAAEETWSFTTTGVTPGDANGDGNVNVLDITKVARIIVGLDAETPGADANEDGSVNVLDITKIARIIVGLD